MRCGWVRGREKGLVGIRQGMNEHRGRGRKGKQPASWELMPSPCR